MFSYGFHDRGGDGETIEGFDFVTFNEEASDLFFKEQSSRNNQGKNRF